MANNNSNDEVRDQVGEQATSAKNAFKKVKKGLSKKTGVKKRVKKKLAKAAKKAAGKLAKMIVSIIKSIISLLISFWWVVLILIGIAIIAFAWHEVEYNQVATGGYTESLDAKEDKSEASLESATILLFYTKYSTHSYYYTVDDDTKIVQATDNQKVKDFENRDSMFALNPSMLYILDKYLNDGNISPEQFIKPIYNTCSTKESADGRCKMKELINKDGDVVSKSVKYKKVQDYKTLKNGEKEEDGFHYEKVDGESEPGTWNWGLAPILHYKKFDQESEVQNYHTASFEIFDRENGGVKTVSADEYNKMSDEQKTEIKSDFNDVVSKTESTPATVKKGDSEDNGEIPADDTAHAVDNVASMFGTITNELKLDWIYQKDYTNVSEPISWEKWYDDATEAEMKNTGLLKKVKGPNYSLEGYKVSYGYKQVELGEKELAQCKKDATEAEEDAEEEGLSEDEQQAAYDKVIENCTTKGGYSITKKDGSVAFMTGDKDKFDVSVKYMADLHVTRNGQLMKHTVSYVDDEPNLSETSGLGYVRSYIQNYTNFIDTNKNDATNQFYCKLPADGNLNALATAALSSDQASLNELWAAVSMKKISGIAKANVTQGTTTNQTSAQLYAGSSSAITKRTQIVASPEQCARNTVAVAIDNKSGMKKFNGTKLPTLQLMGISKELGFNIESSGGSIASTSALSSSTILETGISSGKTPGDVVGDNDASELLRTKYKNQIKAASTAYGVDINLLYSLAEVTSKGDEDYNKNDCTSDKGCGLMGIKTDNFEGGKNLKAYNYTKKVEETFSEAIANNKVNQSDFMDVDNNIIYAAMLMQRYFIKYDYNFMMAIQAYNYGETVNDNFIKYYEKLSGSESGYALKDDIVYEWTAYREYCNTKPQECFNKTNQWGDTKFVEKVLSSFGTVDTISARKKEGNYETFDFKFLKDASSNNSKSKTQAMNNRIMNMYLKKGGAAYWEPYWTGLYAGQKNFDDDVYNLNNNNLDSYLPAKANKITYKNSRSDTDVDSVLQTMFGFAEGTPTDAYDNLSDEYWKTRYSSMFKTAGSKAWSSTYDISKTFNGKVQLPVNSPIIVDNFGWQIREGASYSYKDKTEILAVEGQKVVAMADGKVSAINKDTDGKALVTIVHNDGSGHADKNDEKEDDKDITTESDKDDKPSAPGEKNFTGTWKDIDAMDIKYDEIVNKIEKNYTNLKSDSVFKGKAKFFVDYCKEQDVNPFLIASISALESGYGTSELAKNAFNFGGMEKNHNDSIGSYGGRWAVFASVEAGLKAHIDLLSKYYIHMGLFLPSTMAPKYCEGSNSWVVNVNSIYATISGKICEEATQAKKETVKKYVSYSYYGLKNMKLKKGDTVKTGETIGYVSKSNKFSMDFIDDKSLTDVAEIFRTIEDSRAREMVMMSVGGITGANNIGVDIKTSSYIYPTNPYSYVGQCTWYTWGRINQVTKKSLPGWGNAQDWCAQARESGYKTGSTPSVNAAIIWGGGAYGHVAFVEEYKKDGSFRITEGNYGNPCASPANNCDMVAYAASHPGELLHTVTFDNTLDYHVYSGMQFKCFIYVD